MTAAMLESTGGPLIGAAFALVSLSLDRVVR